MKKFWRILMLAPLLAGAVGCEEDKAIGGYTPASAFSKDGFARDRKWALNQRGKEIKVWGYVDGSNVFPVGGDDNRPGHWRFHLKAQSDDKAGGSFAIHVPVDDGHDRLTALFEANDRAGKPTRVFVTGQLSTFDARGNFTRQTGLFLTLATSNDILPKPPAGQ